MRSWFMVMFRSSPALALALALAACSSPTSPAPLVVQPGDYAVTASTCGLQVNEFIRLAELTPGTLQYGSLTVQWNPDGVTMEFDGEGGYAGYLASANGGPDGECGGCYRCGLSYREDRVTATSATAISLWNGQAISSKFAPPCSEADALALSDNVIECVIEAERTTP